MRDPVAFGAANRRNRGPGSAAHHFVLRCARDTRAATRATLSIHIVKQQGRSQRFCNGPQLVNPFCVVPIAGVLLLSGVGARPPPDGV